MKFKVFLLAIIFATGAAGNMKKWQLRTTKNLNEPEILRFFERATGQEKADWKVDDDLVEMERYISFYIDNKEYFLTLWTYGHHSAAVRIFDPTLKNPLVYFQTSTSIFDYEIRPDSVSIKYYHDAAEDDATQVQFEDTFKPQP